MVDALSVAFVGHGSVYHDIAAFIGLVTLVFVTLLVIGGSPTEDGDNNPYGNDMEDDTEEAGNNGDDVDAMERGVAAAVSAAPKTKRMVSIAHDDIKSKRIVYIHIDVEDGGPMCGLLQISFVVLDADYKELGRFNEFVKPPVNAIWNEQVPFKACTCKDKCFFCEYKLTGPNGPPIKSASVTPAKRRAPPAVVSSTKKVVRNTVKDIERDHVTTPETIFHNSRDCGVCLEENRVRKPTGVEKNNTHINRCTQGCPHLLCREHPVCKEHWPKFKHKKLKYA